MHPYSGLPPDRFWRDGVASQIWSDIDFMAESKFKLSPEERIGTAGSCFARHIAKNLATLGLTHYVSETAPHMLSELRREELQYGTFSARYGNIYTARQLRQLIEFAFAERPACHLFCEQENGWFDLLRPGVQKTGFECRADLECDRLFHLDRVKRLFLDADCMVFTLGLTEAWVDQASGAVFPVCPGTLVGQYDPSSHKFTNFGFVQVLDDLEWCVEFVRRHNPTMKWILTVSPVALAATATNRHVLVANSASKAVLRAVTEDLCSRHSNCEYFPSYEICASVANFGQFLDSDLRNVSARGVKLVMRVFKRAFCSDQPASQSSSAKRAEVSLEKQIEAAARSECDEAFNDPGDRR